MSNENFEEFYQRYYKFSVKIALKIVKNKDNAEDIVQDVFEGLYKMKDRLDGSREYRLRSLVKRVTMNKALDFVRSAYARKELLSYDELELELLTESSDNVEAALLRMEEAEYKRLILQRLRHRNPENFQILIKAKYLDIPIERIADEYGLSPNTVNNRIHRMKRWMEKEISQIYGKS